MKVEIYSDVACPWCYIGKRRFARALAEFAGEEPVDVVFRPYQLDPGAPTAAVPLLQHLQQRFGGSAGGMTKAVTDAAAGEGITIDWDRAQAVNTHTAHRLLRLAEREYGPAMQLAVAEALFDAHFARGGDIGDHRLLTSIARDAGMDEVRAHEYLESGEGGEALDAELETARRMGIQSVPTFVFDEQYAVSGAQPVAVFVDVLQQVRRLTADAAEAADAAAATTRQPGG
jgi:predicted DsbA family dithiol-disulfide isomerase